MSRRTNQQRADRGRLLGALMRIAYHSLFNEVIAVAHDHGFRDLMAMHGNLLQPLWAASGGLRLTELASAAHITKQSMGAIVDQLCDKGYVERVDDPRDGRAKLVRLTKRGTTAVKVIRAAVHAVEADWARRVGAERITQMKSTLDELVASLEVDRA